MGPGWADEIGRVMVRALWIGGSVVALVAVGIGFAIGKLT